MKHKLYPTLVFAFLLLNRFSANAQKTLAVQDYVTVTMDLQGILELNMSTNPEVDFVFNTVQKYQQGITKYNATILEVNSTVAWDLYAQPATRYWEQLASYGTGNLGLDKLPSEILEVKSENPNFSNTLYNFNNFIGLTSNSGSNLGSVNPGSSTQYLAGCYGNGTNEAFRAQSSISKQSNNKFNIHYRIKPGVPVNFPDLNAQYPVVAGSVFQKNTNVQPGYYALEIVYTLSEDL